MKRSIAASIAKRIGKRIWNDWDSYGDIEVDGDRVTITINFNPLGTYPVSPILRDEAYKFLQDVMDWIPVKKDTQPWCSVEEEGRGELIMSKTGVKRKVVEEIKKIIGD